MFPKSKDAIFKSDPASRVFDNAIFKKFGPIKSSIVLCAVLGGLCLLAGYIDGTLYNTKDMIGVLKDYTLFMALPVVILLFFLFHKFSVFAKTFIEHEIEERIDGKKLGNDTEKLDDKLVRL